MDALQEIPVIDVEKYFSGNEEEKIAECQKVVQCLHEFGVLVWRDPRIRFEDNEEYLDLMEEYFELQGRRHYAGQKLTDCKPEFHFQTGVTPEKQERPRNHQKMLDQFTPENMPLSKFPPELDAKWRFFWAIGERPKEVADDIPKVIPAEFPEWESKMNKWGGMMIDAQFTCAEMAAIGMGLDKDTFTSRMVGGPHLLAPTGSDLTKYDVGTSFAGFHYDLNFLTIHGKSRYPGLYVWLRNNMKVPVKMPQGCLLFQAGAMMEHITGGYIHCGYHEVIYTEATKEAYLKQKEAGKQLLWRVSSTLFSHLRYDVDISPLPELKGYYTEEEASRYKKMTAHEKLMEELRAINLAAPSQSTPASGM